MDIEQFILPENIQFQYDQSAMQQLPHDLYDRESDFEEPNTQMTVDQVLQILMENDEFIDTSIHQLIQIAVYQHHLSPSKTNQLMKKIKKIKNIMKRNRAKERHNLIQKSFTFQKKTFMFEQSSTEKDTVTIEKQFKKQRNRISAQVSRDRKKQYVIGLELRNKQLALEAQNLKMENQRLKQQINQNKTDNNTSNPNKQNKTFKGRLVKLLVLLGIVFFIYILRDIFNFKTTRNDSFKMQQHQEQHTEQEIPATVILNENSQIMEEIKKQINQIGHDESDLGLNKLFQSNQKLGLKQAIIKKVSEIKKKVKQLLLPAQLASQLILAKNMLIL